MFIDRIDAGRRLAARLEPMRGQDVVVLGLPRGGVPVALEVARTLGAPLDVIVVRKLGVPYQPELAMGAIGEDGVRVVNDEVVRHARITDAGVRCRGGDRTDRARTSCTTVPGRPTAGLAASDGPRSWSTTASRRGRRRWPPARSPAPTVRHAWCWQCRWRHLVRRSASAPTSTNWSAWRCRSGSPRWASGTRTSRRRPTSRSSIASPAGRPFAAAPREPPGRRTPTDAARVRRRGPDPGRCDPISPDTSPFPDARRPGPWCSPTGAGAAGTAVAIGSSPRC